MPRSAPTRGRARRASRSGSRRVEMCHQVDAEVPDDGAEGDVPHRKAGGQHAPERLLRECGPRLHQLDQCRAKLRPVRGAGDQLRDHLDVTGGLVLLPEVGHGRDERLERPDRLDDLRVALEALRARAAQRLEQQVLERAEVVEDQRLVEGAAARDRPRAGSRDALFAHGLERRLDNRLSSCFSHLIQSFAQGKDGSSEGRRRWRIGVRRAGARGVAARRTGTRSRSCRGNRPGSTRSRGTPPAVPSTAPTPSSTWRESRSAASAGRTAGRRRSAEPHRHDAAPGAGDLGRKEAAPCVRHGVGHRLRRRRRRRRRRRDVASGELVSRAGLRRVGGRGGRGAGPPRRGSQLARGRPGRAGGAPDGAAVPLLRRRPGRRRPAVVPVGAPRRRRPPVPARDRRRVARGRARRGRPRAAAAARRRAHLRPGAAPAGARADAGLRAPADARRAGRPRAPRPAGRLAQARRLRVPLPRAAGGARGRPQQFLTRR